MPQIESEYARQQGRAVRRAYRLHVTRCHRNGARPLSFDAFICQQLAEQIAADLQSL